MSHRLLIMFLAGLLPVPLEAQDAPGDREEFYRNARRQITQPVQQSVDRGLAFLASAQHADGAFGDRGSYRKNVAVTALSGMAFLAGGSTPGRGPYGNHVNQAVRYILSRAQPSGYILSEERGVGQGPMYGHGFATLFLAEVHGMSREPELPVALKKAVDLIIQTQNDEGGWRYFPVPDDADVSVTVCQMVALRAARNAGIAVPKETMDRAVDYLKNCQNADGGFRYQVQARRESLLPRSAAGVVGLYSAGLYAGAETERAVDFLVAHAGKAGSQRQDYYFYGLYYSAQALWQTGDSKWLVWFPEIRDELLDRQLQTGAWTDSFVGTEYATAMSCLVLQTPNDYLPIFQR